MYSFLTFLMNSINFSKVNPFENDVEFIEYWLYLQLYKYDTCFKPRIFQRIQISCLNEYFVNLFEPSKKILIFSNLMTCLALLLMMYMGLMYYWLQRFGINTNVFPMKF